MPQNSDLTLKIFEKVSDISERMAVVETTCGSLQSDVASMKTDIAGIKALDVEQNKSLAEHIEGVKQTRILIAQEEESREKEDGKLDSKISEVKKLEARIETLEEPRKALDLLKRTAKWISVVGAGFLMLTKLLGMW